MRSQWFTRYWVLGFVIVWTIGFIQGQDIPPSDGDIEDEDTRDYIPCGTTVNMEEDHKYYFKTQKFRGMTPPYSYLGGYRTTAYYKRAACLWTFVSSDACHLMVHFEDYYVGDRPCSVQYVSVGDHQTSAKACGYNTLPLAFESTSNFVVVKHYRRPVTKYVTQFEGFAICHSIGTGYEEPPNNSSSYYEPEPQQENVTYYPAPPQYSNNEPSSQYQTVISKPSYQNPPVNNNYSVEYNTNSPYYSAPEPVNNYTTYNNDTYSPPQKPTSYENYPPAASGYQPPPPYQRPPYKASAAYNPSSSYDSPDPDHVDYYPPSSGYDVNPSGPAYAPYEPRPLGHPSYPVYPPQNPNPNPTPTPTGPMSQTTMGSGNGGQGTTPSIPNVPR